MKFSFIRPIDQPPGTRRLLEDLKVALAEDKFSHFKLIVAYAKTGPIYRLRELLEQWRKQGKQIQGIFGYDQQGTSREALELSLTLFDNVYVTREPGLTFHPKIYLFKGKTSARAFIGSNNLTVGGTEKNFEAAVQLDFDLPEEAELLAQVEEAWTTLLPESCQATKVLDTIYLAQLVADGDVIEERFMPINDTGPEVTKVVRRKTSRSGMFIKPESPLPKTLLPRVRKKLMVEPVASATAAAEHITQATALGFAIQIKPHHNGEIFLSVSAALQNPTFFRWPFTGKTTPKKAGNPSYPQLDPDPSVNIVVYDAGSAPVMTLTRYKLNTIYYEKNSEIRITASPLVGVVPDYSVMIMRPGGSPDIDYDITIYTPHSPDYAAWVAACNQVMPSGGKTPRKFGWF